MNRQRPDEWWRGAVLYQVYPRSFADANGDGVGDLPGIVERLPYIAGLGVDAVWLSPFFPSPQADFGYDIADYRGVDPLFGTLDDFDRLIERAHALGLKVVIDQVYSHTSQAHPWFAQSRDSRENDRANWYVWADPKEDGSPPNNWQSVFGGPAWRWDARRSQYYLHNFLVEQPDLNLHNADVVAALIGVAEFWLARGVDGFRLDALNFALHDPLLRDNPPAEPLGERRGRPADYQQRVHSINQPEVVDFIERLRARVEAAGGGFLMAEVASKDAAIQRAYTAGDARLQSSYSFSFLQARRLTPVLVARALAEWPDEPGMGWPAWAFENHDAPRAVTRWAEPADRPAFARLKMLLFAALRGTPILYQGEELGLTQVDIPFERLRDPEAIANWPRTLSRDGARTPMPWLADAPHLGFGGEPWLPHGDDHAALAVDRQEADPASLLAWTRTLLALRRAEPALRLGSASVRRADEQVLVLERAHEGDRLLVAANLSAEPAAWDGPGDGAGDGASGRELATTGLVRETVLGPWSGAISRL